nr:MULTISPECIES: dTMP kinase [unclassified Leptolyngbya]
MIVFEGGEGAGKSTQLQRVCQWLQQSDLWQQLKAIGIASEMVITREPGGTPLGSSIRQLLLHSPVQGDEVEVMGDRTELLLYAADRAQHVEAMLKPALAQGALVFCDRYTDSTVAYQGYGRGLDLSLIHQLNQIATGGLRSDLTLWLDIDPVVGLARTQRRGAADRMEQNKLDFHQRVRQGFQSLFHEKESRTVQIDASATEDVVFERVQAELCHYLKQVYGVEPAAVAVPSDLSLTVPPE